MGDENPQVTDLTMAVIDGMAAVLRSHEAAGIINSREGTIYCTCGHHIPIPGGMDSDGYVLDREEECDAWAGHRAESIVESDFLRAFIASVPGDVHEARALRVRDAAMRERLEAKSRDLADMERAYDDTVSRIADLRNDLRRAKEEIARLLHELDVKNSHASGEECDICTHLEAEELSKQLMKEMDRSDRAEATVARVALVASEWGEALTKEAGDGDVLAVLLFNELRKALAGDE